MAIIFASNPEHVRRELLASVDHALSGSDHTAALTALRTFWSEAQFVPHPPIIEPGSVPAHRRVLIVYSRKTKVHRRMIVADSEAELQQHIDALHPGEGHEIAPHGEVARHGSAHHFLAAKHGPPTCSGRCAVVHPSGLVVNVIMADQEIDQYPGHRLIESDTANIGDMLVT
jgi:hypothetical protein